MLRRDGLLSLAPEWEPQKGQFGYARRLRWVFFDDGGYVAMCKRYRQHARQTGLLKTLAEKRTDEPQRRPARGRGQRLVLGQGRGGHLPRDAGGRHPPHPVEQRRRARDAPPAQRHGRAHQPLRHLPGRDGPGQLPQAPLDFTPTGRRAAGPRT